MIKDFVVRGSNKNFGILFGFLFFLLGLFFHKILLSYFLFLISFIFFYLAFFKDNSLYRLNYLWHLIGFILGKIISPIILGLIYFILVTPIALFSKIFGRDELHLKNGDQDSFWVAKKNYQHKSFKKEF